jgi:hypothetical protein
MVDTSEIGHRFQAEYRRVLVLAGSRPRRQTEARIADAEAHRDDVALVAGKSEIPLFPMFARQSLNAAFSRGSWITRSFLSALNFFAIS